MTMKEQGKFMKKDFRLMKSKRLLKSVSFDKYYMKAFRKAGELFDIFKEITFLYDMK